MTLLAHPRQHRAVRPAQHRRSPWVALILVLALGITLIGVFPLRQIIAQHRQVDMTQAKLDALEVENARLEAQIDSLHTDAELERIAREEFGVVRKGETGYIVTTPGEEPSRPSLHSGPVIVEEPFEGRGLFWRVWDFLTGRDLAPDG